MHRGTKERHQEGEIRDVQGEPGERHVNRLGRSVVKNKNKMESTVKM